MRGFFSSKCKLLPRRKMVETVGSTRRNPSSRQSHSDWKASIPSSSLSVKSVLLHDWWLVKNQNKQISVAGLSYTERSGARVFCSAPISRRIDTTTLETIDGIIITITGFINRTQTLQNGFRFSVCNNFDLGFPFDWEEWVTQCYDEESAKCVSAEKSNFDEQVISSIFSGTEANSSQPLSFDNLPATRIRDFVLHMAEFAESCVHDHITGKAADKAFQHSQEATKSEADRRCSKRGKTEQMCNNDDDDATFSDLKEMKTVLSQSRGFVCGLGSSSKNLGSKEELKFSVSSKNLRNKPGNEISADSTGQLSTPEANKIISKKDVCTMKASTKQDKKRKEAPDTPSVRRSGRLKIQKSYVGMAG